MKNVPMIIDGPNFINRVLECKIDKLYVANQLILRGLVDLVNHQIAAISGLRGRVETVEFVYSRKMFGSGKQKFSPEQRATLLRRVSNEPGIYLEEVQIAGSDEKGVDATIQLKLEEFAKDHDEVVLVSHDKDFIPILNKFKHKVRIITVGITDSFPTELQRVSYATVRVGNEYPWLFEYAYPWFPTHTFTERECATMISNADDRLFNYVVISNNGFVHIQPRPVDNDLAKCIFEASAPYNGYVGPVAASNAAYVSEEYNDIRKAVDRNIEGYIDYHL
jgi:predicted nuclease of predicted toxin-antitoxin system